MNNLITIHLIDDTDLENDKDTLTTFAIPFQGSLLKMKYFNEQNEFFVVTAQPFKLFKYTLIIKNQPIDKINCELKEEIDLDLLKNGSAENIYTQVINERYLLVCSFPLD